ncbi:glutathione S-transferase [Ahrensia sp. R2A130]|uniref:glutathione S-transferase n=1 Tax=Ahrensia sp. R2A130 TaxID=744979 RepID=UPI0001E09420|nr:glutathione S-transferase [Ahrensia sp. R2A130]EFL90577.1 glutathione S-transferase domain-containing protein [Ahrensia sp. R2A130]
MELLAAAASPYVSKVVMAAHHAGVEIDVVNVDATNGDPRLDKANPLAKIPCLVLEDGTGLFDSRVITRHLDRVGNGKLFPTAQPHLAERYEALCDGLNDVTVGGIYEMRFRPEDKVHQPWLDRLWDKANRALTAIADDLPETGANLNIGGIALAASLGYLDLRYAGKWEDAHPAVRKWQQGFATDHADLAALLPSA